MASLPPSPCHCWTLKKVSIPEAINLLLPPPDSSLTSLMSLPKSHLSERTFLNTISKQTNKQKIKTCDPSLSPHTA